MQEVPGSIPGVDLQSCFVNQICRVLSWKSFQNAFLLATLSCEGCLNGTTSSGDYLDVTALHNLYAVSAYASSCCNDFLGNSDPSE